MFHNKQREWHIAVQCDGLLRNLLVRYERRDRQTDDPNEPVDAFHLLENDRLLGVLLLPTGALRSRAEASAVRSLSKLLGCRKAKIQAADAVIALFGR